MSESPITYKIRRKGSEMFSCGAIASSSERSGRVEVSWSKKGKEWKSEKLFKAHLTKCIEYTGGIPDNWEIFELNYKATPIAEWIDANMLIKMLTHKK